MNQLHYPTPDGESCECNSYNTSATCVASCASNIYRYEVRQQFGSGVIKVNCSPDNIVLGCNVKPEYDNVTSHVGNCSSWAVEEKGEDSCVCYEHDDRGATCYAFCAQIL